VAAFATPEGVPDWVGRFGGGGVRVAVEACTGWLVFCEALAEAGAVAHLVEPVETRALRGNKRRAKTDRRGRPLVAPAARRRPVAGGVDCPGARARVTHPHPLAKDAG
jgi:hypothetical protein